MSCVHVPDLDTIQELLLLTLSTISPLEKNKGMVFRNGYREFDAVYYVLQDINDQQLAGICISPRISAGMIHWAQRPQAGVRHVQEMGICTRENIMR
jgi:hypothetical protein